MYIYIHIYTYIYIYIYLSIYIYIYGNATFLKGSPADDAHKNQINSRWPPRAAKRIKTNLISVELRPTGRRTLTRRPKGAHKTARRRSQDGQRTLTRRL